MMKTAFVVKFNSHPCPKTLDHPHIFEGDVKLGLHRINMIVFMKSFQSDTSLLKTINKRIGSRAHHAQQMPSVRCKVRGDAPSNFNFFVSRRVSHLIHTRIKLFLVPSTSLVKFFLNRAYVHTVIACSIK